MLYTRPHLFSQHIIGHSDRHNGHWRYFVLFAYAVGFYGASSAKDPNYMFDRTLSSTVHNGIYFSLKSLY